MPGSSRSTRATISSRTSVGNVARVGEAARQRQHARRRGSRRAPRRRAARAVREQVAPSQRASTSIEGKRALAAGVERARARPVGQLVQRARLARRLEDRALGGGRSPRRSPAPPRSARAARSRSRRRRRTRCRRGATSMPPKRTGARSAARETVEPEPGIVPRANAAGRAAQPVTSRQKPSVTTPPARGAAPRSRTARRARRAAAVGGDHEHLAGLGLGERAEHRQVVVVGLDGEGGAGEAHALGTIARIAGRRPAASCQKKKRGEEKEGRSERGRKTAARNSASPRWPSGGSIMAGMKPNTTNTHAGVAGLP